MNTKTYFLIVSILFISIIDVYSAKKLYADVKIVMLNGQIKNGLIQMPLNQSSDVVIFKKDEEAEKVKIDADEINHLIIYANGSSFLLKRSQTINLRKKLSKGKYWSLMKIDCKNINTYILVLGFDINSNGDFLAMYDEGSGMYMIQRKGEKHPSEVEYIFIENLFTQKMFDKQMKKNLLEYYKNDPDAIAFLNTSERIKFEEVVEFIESQCEK